ncbi:ATP-dependent RNA helicase DDX24 [Toxocara canis]|uniref:ATP-dependent RNA helicase n=1 Tax=Toxocara canis TaxID=6265 RepID=A0A0B2VUL6_TOXCA|nr:ATP-dependent RNA helicase DDX24 [Toxocara canis]
MTTKALFEAMPKVISAGRTWRPIEVPGEFASDTNLTFLSAIEELTPASVDQHSGTDRALTQVVDERDDSAGNKIKHNVRVLEKVADNENEISAENTQQKRRKKKKRLQKAKMGFVEGETDCAKGDSFVGDIESKKKKRKVDRSPEKRLIEGETEKESVQTKEGIESTSAIQADKVDLSAWAPFCLPDEIMRSLADLGFTEPTEIQKLVLPCAVRDKLDILGAAETGSGKTLAYVIPLVVRLLDAQNSDEDCSSERCLRALILAPTRELVVQIRKHLDAIIKYTNFKATSVVGGLSQQKQERLLKYRPEIVVATPGRLWALAENVLPGSYLANWQKLLCLAVDETDRMVEKGHFEELQFIMKAIKSEGNVKRQTFVFSATLTFVHPAPRRLDAKPTQKMTVNDKIDRLIEIIGLRKKPKIIDITRPMGTAEALVETRMDCTSLIDKDTKVVYLLTRYPGRTLIFMNSVDASRRFRGILMTLRFEPLPLLLHAKMAQKQRLKNLEQFSEVPNSILLATDVAARGLDICGVEHVIHYQVPKTAELYVHRSGRTARAWHKGLTVLMVDPQDAQYYRRICSNLNRKQQLPIYPVDCTHLFDVLKERVLAATEVESLEHRIKKIASRETWFEKAAREADLLLDARDREKENANEDLVDLRRQKKAAEGRLRAALALSLPPFDHVQLQKTRYITPEVMSSYAKTVTRDAISSFEENSQKEQYAWRDRRVIINRSHLRRFNDKRKRKKLKRK